MSHAHVGSHPQPNRLADLNGVDSSASGDYTDTVALLQEELAKLEQENQMLREARDAQTNNVSVGQDLRARLESSEARVRDLVQELNSREETIGLLLDQIALGDEAEAAMRSEWQQLNQWLTELEHRVERNVERNAEPSPELLAKVAALEESLETEKRRATDRQDILERGNRELTAQKTKLEEEIDRLHAQISEIGSRLDDKNDAMAVVTVLEEENRRLRENCVALSKEAAKIVELDTVRNMLEVAEDETRRLRSELESARAEFRNASDEHRREKNEYEAAMMAMRSQAARHTLQAQREAALAVAQPAAPHGSHLTHGSHRQKPELVPPHLIPTPSLLPAPSHSHSYNHAHNVGSATMPTPMPKAPSSASMNTLSGSGVIASGTGSSISAQHFTPPAAVVASGSAPTHPSPISPTHPTGRDISIDERIRAFRQHLQDVHIREEEERQKNSFAGRLTKVWVKSRPK